MKLHTLIILVLLSLTNISAQYFPDLKPDINTDKPQIVRDTEAKVNKITEEAGIYFKQGLLGLRDSRSSQARTDFDKSVEVFLTSTVDVRSNAKLQGCYSQLVETVYRIEFPSGQTPQIRSLAATCGWNIDNQLADNIARLSAKPSLSTIGSSDKSLVQSVAGRPVKDDIPPVGFSDQKFEPSPLDELAKLELTPEELQAESGYRITRAQAGDTVAKIAARAGVPAAEVAKLNGLFPDSVVSPGREIKIAVKSKTGSSATASRNRTVTKPSGKIILAPAGAKPVQQANGTVPIVIKYLYDTLNDPYSVKYVKWSPVQKVSLNGYECWAVVLKLRAKNVFNAYILGEMIFYIRNNKIVEVARLN